MASLSRVFTRSYSAVMASAKSAVADTTAAVKKTAVKKTAVKKTAVKKTEAKVPTGPRKLTGILKPMPVSPALTAFIGAPEVSRTEAVKKIWEYIKLHNLQNPENKREVFCDEKLKTILDGKEAVQFYEIAKLLSQHFVRDS